MLLVEFVVRHHGSWLSDFRLIIHGCAVIIFDQFCEGQFFINEFTLFFGRLFDAFIGGKVMECLLLALWLEERFGVIFPDIVLALHGCRIEVTLKFVCDILVLLRLYLLINSLLDCFAIFRCHSVFLCLICVLNEGVCNLFGFLKALLCPRESFVIFDFLEIVFFDELCNDRGAFL